MLSWKVPIVFRDQLGEPARSIHAYAHPFVDIELATDHDGGVVGWTRTRAMVDTGASYTMIAPSLLTRLGSTSSKTVELAGNFSRHKTAFYKICIRASGAEAFTLESEIGELEVPLDDGKCLAVLGMDYLRFCRCVIEGPIGDSYLEVLASRIELARATARPAMQ